MSDSETYFAPPERTEKGEFSRQLAALSTSPVMTALLESMSGLFIVLNEDRQIVAFNQEFLRSTGIDNPDGILGLRLGQSIQCIHAESLPNGCGTTPYCLSCGAAIAMMATINDNRPAEQVCALTARKNGNTLDIALEIKTRPLKVDGKRWILVFARDITQQQTLVNLERIFFHDINNILSGILANAQLLLRGMPDNPKLKRLSDASQRLCSEVLIQKALSVNRDIRYLVQKRDCSLNDLKQELRTIARSHASARGKKIIENWPENDILISTDIFLASKVLMNMLINALEATEPGDFVKLQATADPESITWRIWNRIPIPDPSQKRIFQRHYSTKPGVGRGLGTYAMKLFGETYLDGRVCFESSPGTGTTFEFRLPLIS